MTEAPAGELRKSVHLTNAWHAKSGGIRTFYRALLEAAERRGHLLRLIVPGDQDGVEETGAYGRIYRIKSPMAPVDREYRMIDPRAYLLPGSRIPEILIAERPDLVEVNDKYTLMYLGGMLRKRLLPGIKWRPTVVGLSCERMDQNMAFYLFGKESRPPLDGGGRDSSRHSIQQSLTERFAHAYMKWLNFPMFDHHITVSEHCAAELRVASRGHKIRRGVWVLPIGVELECFSAGRRSSAVRAGLRNLRCTPAGVGGPSRLAGSGNPFYLLYVGRLAPEKNLRLLVDLMARLQNGTDPSFHLLVAGSGPLRRWFEERAQALAPSRVHFLEHIDDRDRLADLYANADAFVHPNPDEPFGIALLEAMASGLPLVAPNRGGVTQYANGENAWTASAIGESFEKAVREIASDPVRTRVRVQRALVTASTYGWGAVTDKFLELYKGIHRLRTGTEKQPSVPPLFYSTPGDYWGRESRSVQSPAMARS